MLSLILGRDVIFIGMWRLMKAEVHNYVKGDETVLLIPNLFLISG